jgi:hypothetical protein
MSKEVETMKKFLMAVAVLACMTSLAFAGPNAGGKLVAHDPSLLVSQTNGSVSVCGQGVVPPTCLAIDTEIDGALQVDPSVFKVYAAFPDGSAPRLMGLTWGITYDPTLVVIAGGNCGNFELNTDTWPQSGSGSSVTYGSPQTALLTPVYWFMGYNYAPSMFNLGPHPDPLQGGTFGDDSVPAILDPIAGYGQLGFDQPGSIPDVVCPGGVTPAACCDPATGNCTITMPADCQFNFHPEWLSCQPNNCPPPPTGACCAADGTCSITTGPNCGGQYLGDGSTCDGNPCALTGACCAPDLTCTITTQADCQGTYMGDGTVCESNTCVVPAQKTTWGSIKNNYR